MEAYSYLNNLLLSKSTSYEHFQSELIVRAVHQETYLNLFLVTVVSNLSNSPDFPRYVQLLTSYHKHTGKKSANINYIGYKDRRSVFMHACQKGTPQAIQHLLKYPLDWEVRDPNERSVAFYAIRNGNEDHSNAILAMLLNAFPNLLFMEAINGHTLLNEAVEMLRVTTMELLLRRGADINKKLKNTGNTISHELLKLYQHNKETVLAALVLFARYKANFYETNNEGVSVLDRARVEGIDLQNYASFCQLLEIDDSVAEQTDNEFDKISLTTLNQRTKGFDTTSEIFESDSRAESGQVDFSQLDEPYSIFKHKLQQEQQEQQQIISDDQSSSSQTVEQCELDFQALSQEIVEVSMIDEQMHADMVPLAEKFFASVDKIVNRYGLVIDIVGSFATGLWTTRSDINISLIPRSNEYINFEVTLQKIYKQFKINRHELNIEDIFFTKSKVSCIKLSLGGQYKGQSFNIAIFHRNHLNQQYVTYIREYLETYPVIRPLFFVYRRMCEVFGLADPQNGGIKTYALFLMIISVVKSMPTTNLGALFYHIAIYYGFSFQYGFDQSKYEEQEISEVSQYPKMKFNLIDPYNPRNNIGGKSTKADKLRNMFRAIYYYLMEGGVKPYLQNMFCLQSIMPCFSSITLFEGKPLSCLRCSME